MEKKVKINKNNAQYMPLYNLNGLKSSITPFFGGDIKLDHHHYLLEPTTETNLYTNHMSRNMIFTINDEMYFLNGNTHLQQNDEVTVDLGLFYQKLERKNPLFRLETLSFIALKDDVELHKITLTNTTTKPFELDAITYIPIYGRSADNIRDHRHVTSLLNRIKVQKNSVVVEPTLSFDERGHIKNAYSYVVSAFNEAIKPNRFITSLEDFINGGSFTHPKGIYQKGLDIKDGYEALGGIGFEKVMLKPNESTTFILSLGIFNEDTDYQSIIGKYETIDAVDKAFKEVQTYFQSEKDKLKIEMYSNEVNNLMEWVRFQPVLRRIFGNSYLPHHDYGRGGRGWRDLWQDLLSLIMIHDDSVEGLLFNNFQGIRIDGSNATIIGDEPGSFSADRNKIVRVWSDHGAWPLLTTLSYMDTTGDINFLFKKQGYFEDQFTHYTNKTKDLYDDGYRLKVDQKPYLGTILEHLLLQNVVAYFNVGQFGFVRLENADWNDGLDMAKEHGETIAFTHFYASNLKKLSDIIKKTSKPIYLFKALKDLIFENIKLSQFFDEVAIFKEDVVLVDKDKLSKRLDDLYQLSIKHINKHAWIKDSHLQSYVTNSKVYLDDIDSMNLTGQAMALLNETLTHQQALSVATSTKKLLFNEKLGGYHLNTNYHKPLRDLGRAYGFAYNHKENGAVFSHMAIMYVYGLYNYNLVHLGNEGYKALIMRALSIDSHTILGIPEYFTEQGVGKYLYLTGSASWLLKLIQEQVFGIKYNLGKLSLNPKLVREDFIDSKASIQTHLYKILRKITYINLKNLDYGQYKIHKIVCKGKEISLNEESIQGDIEVYLDEI